MVVGDGGCIGFQPPAVPSPHPVWAAPAAPLDQGVSGALAPLFSLSRSLSRSLSLFRSTSPPAIPQPKGVRKCWRSSPGVPRRSRQLPPPRDLCFTLSAHSLSLASSRVLSLSLSLSLALSRSLSLSRSIPLLLYHSPPHACCLSLSLAADGTPLPPRVVRALLGLQLPRARWVRPTCYIYAPASEGRV